MGASCRGLPWEIGGLSRSSEYSVAYMLDVHDLWCPVGRCGCLLWKTVQRKPISETALLACCLRTGLDSCLGAVGVCHGRLFSAGLQALLLDDCVIRSGASRDWYHFLIYASTWRPSVKALGCRLHVLLRSGGGCVVEAYISSSIWTCQMFEPRGLSRPIVYSFGAIEWPLQGFRAWMYTLDASSSSANTVLTFLAK
jgi:hypothetical protein